MCAKNILEFSILKISKVLVSLHCHSRPCSRQCKRVVQKILWNDLATRRVTIKPDSKWCHRAVKIYSLRIKMIISSRKSSLMLKSVQPVTTIQWASQAILRNTCSIEGPSLRKKTWTISSANLPSNRMCNSHLSCLALDAHPVTPIKLKSISKMLGSIFIAAKLKQLRCLWVKIIMQTRPSSRVGVVGGADGVLPLQGPYQRGKSQWCNWMSRIAMLCQSSLT